MSPKTEARYAAITILEHALGELEWVDMILPGSKELRKYRQIVDEFRVRLAQLEVDAAEDAATGAAILEAAARSAADHKSGSHGPKKWSRAELAANPIAEAQPPHVKRDKPPL